MTLLRTKFAAALLAAPALLGLVATSAHGDDQGCVKKEYGTSWVVVCDQGADPSVLTAPGSDGEPVRGERPSVGRAGRAKSTLNSGDLQLTGV